MSALLAVDDLKVAYGKAQVVHGASLTVEAGEFVTLLGRNGAGKSTTLHAVSSLIAKQGGSVRFDGHDITRATPRDIVRAGLVQVLEGHRVFTALTVEDNLLIGTYAHHPRGDRSRLDAMYAVFPELAERRRQSASRLSGGQQQILAVAQGMISQPRLLVLDEPSGRAGATGGGSYPGRRATAVPRRGCRAAGGATGGKGSGARRSGVSDGGRAHGARGAGGGLAGQRHSAQRLPGWACRCRMR